MEPHPAPTVNSEPTPWWRSKTVLGIAITLAPRLLALLGVEIAADDPELTRLVESGAAFAGAAVALYGRAKAKGPLALKTPPAAAGLVFVIGATVACSGCAYRPGLFNQVEQIGGSLSYTNPEGQTLAAGASVKLRDPRGFAK